MIESRNSKFAHIEWLDLKQNGVMTECAVMKRDQEGNIYFFEVAPLDNIDKTRLRNIIMNRNAKAFELWDLMSQITLGNGLNALHYFHQLVKIMTPTGQIINPRSGQMGVESKLMRISDPNVEVPVEPTVRKATRTPKASTTSV